MSEEKTSSSHVKYVVGKNIVSYDMKEYRFNVLLCKIISNF